MCCWCSEKQLNELLHPSTNGLPIGILINKHFFNTWKTSSFQLFTRIYHTLPRLSGSIQPSIENWFPLWQGGRNSSFQYGNTGCCRRQTAGSATVNSQRIAVLFENKVHLKISISREVQGCTSTDLKYFFASDSIEFWFFFICSFKILLKI